MRHTTFVLFLSLFLLQATTLLGQKYSNEFMSSGTGARAQAMGNAAIVNTQNAYSAYWNPAGIAGIHSNMEVGFMHSEWFAGVGKYDFASAVYSLTPPGDDEKRSIGISAIRFGIDDIPNTLSLYGKDGAVNYDNVVPFSAADYGFMFTYAQNKRFGSDTELYFGGNAKVIYREIGTFANAFGFGFDLGVQLHKENWSVGLSIRDASSTFNAWKFSFTEDEKETLAITDNDIPISALEVTKPTFILGGAYHKRLGNIGLLAESNIIITTDGKRNTLLSSNVVSLAPNIGLELDLKEVIFFRAGINRFQKEVDANGKEKITSAPTLGMGIRFKKVIDIDYAFTDISQTSQKTYSHVISLLLELDFATIRKNRYRSLSF